MLVNLKHLHIFEDKVKKIVSTLVTSVTNVEMCLF